LFPLNLRSRPRRRALLAAASSCLFGAAVYAFVHAGTFLAPEDPLTKADAIFVLAGTRVELPL
jgi:hypothetical protein